MTRYPAGVWLALAGDAVSACGSGLTLPYLVVYLTRERHFDTGTAGLVMAGIAAASFVGNPLGGELVDRRSPRSASAMGLAVSSVGSVVVLFAADVPVALAAALLLGLGASITWPAFDAMLAEAAPAGRRSPLFALRYATFNAGLALGSLTAAVVVNEHRPSTFVLLFTLDAVSFATFAVIVLAVPAARRVHNGSAPRGSVREIAGDPVFRLAWLVMAGLVIVGYAQLLTGLPALAIAQGLGAGVVGAAMATNAITVCVAQPVVVLVMRTRRRTQCLYAVVIVWALAWAVVLTVPHVGRQLGCVTFAAAFALFGIGETFLSPVMPALINDLAPDHLRGRYNGTFVLAITTGHVVGPVLAGVILTARRPGLLCLASAAGCLVIAVLTARLARRLPAHADRMNPSGPAHSSNDRETELIAS